MRAAFIDFNFSWPPNGGADVDLYHVLRHLDEAGAEVKLFALQERGVPDRGRFDPGDLPFAAEAIRPPGRGLAPEGGLAQNLRAAVSAWRPSVVVIAHAYTLKPLLIEALEEFPLVARYYAHELACARDPYRYRDGQPCPYDYLRTPDTCRRCAFESLRGELRDARPGAWTRDYLAARAYAPDYHARLIASLAKLQAAIVYNEDLARHAAPYLRRVAVVPGGVDVQAIRPPLRPPKSEGKPKVIYMSGRADDPRKGLHVLLEAGRLLAERRSDFLIRATHYDYRLATPWFEPAGWHDHDTSLRMYAEADIAAVPSVWDEPFGLVAAEAMAWELPVCASNAGGLSGIVRHGETGWLFAPGDARGLAGALERLLDRHALRVEMGCAGRQRAQRLYDWPRIVRRHYLPLFEELARKRSAK